MKTLDTFTKRILVVAVSISLILLSLSVFLSTLQQATAAPKQVPTWYRPTIVGLGIYQGTGYYMYYDEQMKYYRTSSIYLQP